MPSAIDSSKPTAVTAYTADVRQNFASAKSEIEALQASDTAHTAAIDAAQAAAASAQATANNAQTTANNAAAAVAPYTAEKTLNVSMNIVVRAYTAGRVYYWVPFPSKMSGVPTMELHWINYGTGASNAEAYNPSVSGFEISFIAEAVGNWLMFRYTATVY